MTANEALLSSLFSSPAKPLEQWPISMALICLLTTLNHSSLIRDGLKHTGFVGDSKKMFECRRPHRGRVGKRPEKRAAKTGGDSPQVMAAPTSVM